MHWDKKRQRFIASLTVGYNPDGKRIVRRGSGKTETQARAKLKEVIRDHDDGVALVPHNLTVAQVVTDSLAYGLNGRAARTLEKCTYLCEYHVIPSLGRRKARELTATDVDQWLAVNAKTLSTRTLQEMHHCLNRAFRRAMARDQIKRSVVELCTVPRGRPGRPSKSLTVAQATALLGAAEEMGDLARTDTFLSDRYRRLARRRGKKRAIVAVGNSLLTIIWHVLSKPDSRYRDLGSGYYESRLNNQRRQRELIRQLEQLTGQKVTLDPTQAA